MRHVEVELGLGVAAVGRRARRVARLGPRAVEDGLVDDAGRAVVQPVVAGVDADDLAGQRLPSPGRASSPRRTASPPCPTTGRGQRRPPERAEVAARPRSRRSRRHGRPASSRRRRASAAMPVTGASSAERAGRAEEAARRRR